MSRKTFPQNWEVLNGVGVDGVGRIFPLFLRIFPLFLRIFPLFLRNFPLFLRISPLFLKDKAKEQQFTAKMGNFTPTPSAPTPCKTSRQNCLSLFLRCGAMRFNFENLENCNCPGVCKPWLPNSGSRLPAEQELE